MSDAAVTVVIPVHNGRRTLPAVLRAVARECSGRRFEIVAVEDGSVDGSTRYLRRLAETGRLRLVHGEGRGIAAAINAGIREARYPFIAQIDQDVIVEAGWLPTLLAALEDPDVAAAQGQFVTPPDAGFWARVMGRDLEHRCRRIAASDVDHVCTGNTVYRASALHGIGLFDESLGYGSDNDLSYRLIGAGYRLAFRREARAVHLWRETARDYCRQQFGVGYGRLDVVAKHPRRMGGDVVSGPGMILHAPLMLIGSVLTAVALVAWPLGGPLRPCAWAAGLILGLLTAERFAAGAAAWSRTGDRATLAFPLAHGLRDLCWSGAIIVWATRRILGTARSPGHSMPRPGDALLRPIGWQSHQDRRGTPTRTTERSGAPPGVLVLIPAFNEGVNLRRVVDDVRRRIDADILIVNDGSTDGTAELLPQLGVHWLSLPDRVGVGGAVRAGLRFAVRRGFEHVIRIDGDGQHNGRDAARLLRPVEDCRADVTLGSRYLGRGGRRSRGLSKSALALLLTILTRRRISDPTSGCWVFGRRAVRLLARSHPTGYPEPELILLLHRHGLAVAEVPVRARPRHSGRTTLTWFRTAAACARTILVMLMVPMRPVEREGGAGE